MGCSPDRYFLSICYVPGTVLSIGNILVNKLDAVPTHISLPKL